MIKESQFAWSTPSSTGFSLTVARYGNGNEDTPILHVQVVR